MKSSSKVLLVVVGGFIAICIIAVLSSASKEQPEIDSTGTYNDVTTKSADQERLENECRSAVVTHADDPDYVDENRGITDKMVSTYCTCIGDAVFDGSTTAKLYDDNYDNLEKIVYPCRDKIRYNYDVQGPATVHLENQTGMVRETLDYVRYLVGNYFYERDYSLEIDTNCVATQTYLNAGKPFFSEMVTDDHIASATRKCSSDSHLNDFIQNWIYY